MKIFFTPNAVAIVGASRDRGGYQLFKNVHQSFEGPVYPVNPNYPEIDGVPCLPRLEEVPRAVDLAICFLPAPAVPAVLESCARKGVHRVMIQSAGFSEVGERGEQIQDRCSAIAREAGIRIWGPNCMGLVDMPRDLFFSFMNPRIKEKGLLPGRISLIVQSGMLSAGFLNVMSQRSIGVAKVCSIGNKADVDESDLLPYLLQDPDTDVVVMYLEAIPRGRRFAEIARSAVKPLVLLKGGRSAAGSEAAMSHTASLAGNARLLEGVLQMAGVIMARDFHQMMDLGKALSLCPRVPAQCRTAIVTFSGGAGILSCDLLAEHGLRTARFSEKTHAALSDIFPKWMPPANPVDLFPAVVQHGRVPAYEQAIDAILADPNVDVIFLQHFAGLEDGFLDMAELKKDADRAGKTVLFWMIGTPEGAREIHWLGQRSEIAVYGEIERAVEGLAAAARFEPKTVETLPLPVPNNKPDPYGWPACKTVLDEYDSKRILSRWNIPVVRERIVGSLKAGRAAGRELGFPLVMKGLVPGQAHKTEAGLVHLGLHSQKALANSYRQLRGAVGEDGRILIQEQVKTDYELIAGFLRDDQFGPCVMFGIGGVFSELEPDVAFTLAPLHRLEARQLTNCLRRRDLLNGYRGSPPLDRDAMADLLVRLGELGSRESRIRQIDINPVVVRYGAPLAVDASVVLKAKGEPADRL